MSSSTSWPLTERVHLPAYPLGTGTGDGQQIKRNAPPRFQVAQRQRLPLPDLIDPAYADPMREWLGSMLPGSLLILDEAHHAAPSSGGRYGIESKFTRTVRDLCYAVIGKRLKISKGSAFNACKAA